MNNLDIIYQDLLKEICNTGVPKKEKKYLYGKQINLTFESGFPILTVKEINWNSLVIYLLWILKGDNNIKNLIENDCFILNDFIYNEYLEINKKIDLPNSKEFKILSKEEFFIKIINDPNFANNWGNISGLGMQWRKYNKIIKSTVLEGDKLRDEFISNDIDQLSNVINELRLNPDSKNLYMDFSQTLDSFIDYKTPFNYGIQFFTRDLTDDEYEKIDFEINENSPRIKSLSLILNQSRIELIDELPFYVSMYSLFLKLMSKWLGMYSDKIIFNFGEIYLQDENIKKAEDLMKKNYFDPPSFSIEDEDKISIDFKNNNINELLNNLTPDLFELKNYKFSK